MPKPKKIEISEDVNHTIEFAEDSELPAGKKKKIEVRIHSGDNAGHKTGYLVRHFYRVDGIPMATLVLISNADNGGAQVNAGKEIQPVKGSAHSLRVLAWDRKVALAGADHVQSRRVRFKVK